MTDYKRFISYMYVYTNGIKKKNVGYARVETRNGECRFKIYMHMERPAEGIFPTYLIYRPAGEMELIYIGDCVARNQTLEGRLTVSENNVMDSGLRFSDMGGLLLFHNTEIFYATQWDDKPVILNEVLEALKPKSKDNFKTEHGLGPKLSVDKELGSGESVLSSENKELVTGGVILSFGKIKEKTEQSGSEKINAGTEAGSIRELEKEIDLDQVVLAAEKQPDSSDTSVSDAGETEERIKDITDEKAEKIKETKNNKMTGGKEPEKKENMVSATDKITEKTESTANASNEIPEMEGITANASDKITEKAESTVNIWDRTEKEDSSVYTTDNITADTDKLTDYERAVSDKKEYTEEKRSYMTDTKIKTIADNRVKMDEKQPDTGGITPAEKEYENIRKDKEADTENKVYEDMAMADVKTGTGETDKEKINISGKQVNTEEKILTDRQPVNEEKIFADRLTKDWEKTPRERIFKEKAEQKYVDGSEGGEKSGYEENRRENRVPLYMLPRGYKIKEKIKPLRDEKPINPWDQVERYRRFEAERIGDQDRLQENKEQQSVNEEKMDNRTIEKLFNSYPRIYPFEDNEIKRCVKIEPKDIGALPSDMWALSNNSFLLHGYYCYHHLILAEIKDRYGCRYIIGVPGIYHNRERFMARMFGFENFKSIRKRDLRQGDFGYWYLEIRL